MDGDISISERLIGRVQSNMRAEFTAVIEGLRAMRLNDDGCRKVIVYSDCKGVVEACNGGIERRRMFGWRHTKNCDLWKLLEYEVSWWGDRLDVKHVYAHTKTIGWKATFNERVDLMAKEGARKWDKNESNEKERNPDGNTRNDGEYMFYETRLKMCDKCKLPVNVCVCKSMCANSLYDRGNDQRMEELSVTNRYNLRYILSRKVSAGCVRTTHGRMRLVSGNRQCFDRSSL